MIPQLYPLCFTHRLEPIGNGQQVQIGATSTLRLNASVRPSGEKDGQLSPSDCRRWRGRQSALFSSVNRQQEQPGRLLG